MRQPSRFQAVPEFPEQFCTDGLLDCADWRIHDLISGDLGYCVRFYDRYKNEVKARKDLEACNEYSTGMTPEDPGVNPKGGVILNEREFCINSCNKEAYIYPTYRVPCCLRCVEKVLKNPEEWGSISNCMALTCGGA